MKVLGVSYGYHDASACLAIDGQVVAAAAEERFTRQKHDPAFPTYAIDWCLSEGGLSPRDLDQVVFHEDPHAKFARVMTTALAPFPGSRREFVNSIKAWLGKKLWALGTVSSRLDLPPERIGYLGHHFSHGVQAFMGSGFDEAGILIVDAVGDWACTALYRGAWKDGKPEVERILEIAYPNSLGLVYSAFTAHLGFSPNDSECSTMALAAFGRPVYADALREIVKDVGDGTYEVNQSYFNFVNFYRGAVTPRFVEKFGKARLPRDPLPFASFGEQKPVSDDQQRWADLAASVQLVLEERVLSLTKLLHEKSGSKNLCYAGGVSLNCVANGRLRTETPFENFHIPPDPGDGGTSVGTALYYAALQGDTTKDKARHGPFVGPAVDEAADIEMISFVKTELLAPYLHPGVEYVPGTKWATKTYDDDAELWAEVTRRLMAGEIVGLFQGRAELGPRALGSRSIVCRPDDVALATRLSKKVKDRAAYRPYALSMTYEDAPKILAEKRGPLRDYRWMQFAVGVQAEVVPRVVTALHVDQTTRAQVCAVEDNPRWHALLTAFGREFGLAAVLNTSFNPSGYPIVSTPAEALSMYARTDMDALVLNRSLVWKEKARG